MSSLLWDVARWQLCPPLLQVGLQTLLHRDTHTHTMLFFFETVNIPHRSLIEETNTFHNHSLRLYKLCKCTSLDNQEIKSVS